MKSFLLVFLGGGFGSIARYLLIKIMPNENSTFPWGTLTVNLLGCFLIGLIMDLFSTLIFFGFLLLFMYFIIIRPQNKRNKEINAMLSKLDVGAEIIAASGIIGKVKAIKGEYISIEVSENVVFKLQKSAIASILPKGTIDSINNASNYIRAIEERQGLKIACLEEIALKKDWISHEEVLKKAMGGVSVSYTHLTLPTKA